MRRLASIRVWDTASGGAALSAQQTAEVKKLYMMLHKEFLVRRRKCVDALDRVAEGTSVPKGCAAPRTWRDTAEHQIKSNMFYQ